MVVTRYVGGAIRVIHLQGSSAHTLLGADGVQLELPLRPTLCDQRCIYVASAHGKQRDAVDKPFSGGDFKMTATQSMNRSVLLAGVLCIPMFYAFMKGDFVVILMSVVAGYEIHALLG